MKISKRLKKVASYLEDATFLLDVGCDHGLLDVYLAKKNPNIKILATDISWKSLKKAENNVLLYDVGDRVVTKCSDGLALLSEEITEIVIAGIGGIHISEMFSSCNLSKIKKIVICAHGNSDKVREKLVTLGFMISDEDIILDMGKYYVIDVFVPGIHKYSKRDILYGPNINKNKDYVKYLINKLRNNLSKIPRRYIVKRYRLRKEIRYLNKII